MEEYIKMSLESYNDFLDKKAQTNEILYGDKTVRMTTHYGYHKYVLINPDEATIEMAKRLYETEEKLLTANLDLSKIRKKWWYRLFN